MQFYVLLGEIVAGAPDAVVVEINLRMFGHLGDGFRHFRNLSRELSFWRAVRVWQALAADDLSLVDPPLYRMEESLDALYVVEGVQILGRDWLASLGHLVGESLHLRRALPERLRVYDGERARGKYSSPQNVHRFAGVLRETLLALRTAHVPGGLLRLADRPRSATQSRSRGRAPARHAHRRAASFDRRGTRGMARSSFVGRTGQLS